MIEDLEEGAIQFIYVIHNKYDELLIVNTRKDSLPDYLNQLPNLVSGLICKSENHYEYFDFNNVRKELIIADLCESEVLKLAEVGGHLEFKKTIDFENTDKSLQLECLSTKLKLNKLDILLIALKQKAWNFYKDIANHDFPTKGNIIENLIQEINLKKGDR